MFYNTRIKLSQTEKKKEKFAQAQTGHKVHILYAQLEATVRGIQTRGWDTILQLVFPLRSGKMTIAFSSQLGMLFVGNMLRVSISHYHLAFGKFISGSGETPGIQVEALQQ